MNINTCILPEQFYSLSNTTRIFIGFIFSIIFGLFWFYGSMLIGSIIWNQSFFDFIETIKQSTTLLQSKAMIHFLLVTQSISMFMIPAIVMTKIIRCNIVTHWNLNALPSLFFIFLVIQIIIVNIPGMNFWSGINTSIVELFVDNNSSLHKMYLDSIRVTKFIVQAPTIFDVIINILCIAVVPAITEEFFFRGMLQRYAARAIGRIEISILLTAFIFSILHADIYNFLPRFCMGIIFGYLYWYTNNLWIPIIAHFIHNASVVVTYYLIQHGIFHDHFEYIGMWGHGAIFGITSVLVVSLFIAYMVTIKMQVNLSEKEE